MSEVLTPNPVTRQVPDNHDSSGSADVDYDVVIIGGGQSGLYAAKWLQERAVKCLVLERGEVGQAWRDRFPDMPLFSSRRFSSLPGMTVPGDPKGFPTCAEIAAYFQQYAAHFSLPVRTGCHVNKVTTSGGDYLIHVTCVRGAAGGQTQAQHGVIRARALINATGSNQVAQIPDFADQLGADVLQYDAEHFTPASLAQIDASDGRPVVVVGDGASGRFIAAKLAPQHHVWLAKGQKRAFPPRELFGQELFWWLNRLGIAFADKQSLVAKLLKKRNPVPCGEHSDRRLKRLGVQIGDRVVSASTEAVMLASGASVVPKAVVWAIGYADQTHWLAAVPEAVDQVGGFIEHYGRTPAAGLFVLGRKWLSCRASELIMGVQKDAELVLPVVVDYVRAHAALLTATA